MTVAISDLVKLLLQKENLQTTKTKTTKKQKAGCWFGDLAKTKIYLLKLLELLEILIDKAKIVS